MKNITLIFGILFLFIIQVNAQFGNPDQFLRTNVYLSQDKFLPGQNIKIAYKFELYKQYHINSNNVSEDFSIPTELKISLPPEVSLGRMIYPKAVSKKFAFTDEPISVYEGENIIWTTLSISKFYQADSLPIKISFSFQACNDHSCFAPTSKDTTIILWKAKNTEEISSIHSKIFQSFPSSGNEESTTSANGLEKTLEEKGLLLFLLALFIGGLGLNLTPCVYPIIPITIAYFTNQAQSQKGSHVGHAIFYFLGMVLMYSTLGLIAALSGSIMGAWLQNPIVIIFVVLVMIALATSMFGLWEIRIPQKLATFAGKSRTGYIGTLVMGLTVGFIAAPCIGPFVLALITLVAKLANPFLGFLMFLSLSMGLGLPYLLLGIFTSSLNKIPRSGGWMIWVRNLFGFVMLAMAVYFLNPLIKNETVYWILMGILAVSAGIYSLLDKNTSVKNPRSFNMFKKFIAFVLIVFGIYIGWPSSSEKGEEIFWQKYTPEIYQTAITNNKPTIMDFYADWCLPCKELDKFTFSNLEVIELSKKFNMIKVDLTNNSDPKVKEIMKQFEIKGVPTVVFIDRQGQIRKDLSFVGYINAKEFLKKMKKLQ